MGDSRGMAGVSERFSSWVEYLEAEFLEREAAVRLALLAPIAGHHLLLLGPPGTAKTMLAEQVTRVFDALLFRTLLTKFSTPEDVFGPLSLPQLEKGVYERLTEGYLPRADIAFIDEIYKANASILNALLSVLNERIFVNGAERETVPLMSLLAASNEVPDDDEGLDALDDRLLLRVVVPKLGDSKSFARLVSRSKHTLTTPPTVQLDHVRAVREEAAHMEIPASMIDAMVLARQACDDEQLEVSDRRWRQAVDLMAVCALLDGTGEVGFRHLGVLRYVLWRRPADQPKAVAALRRVLESWQPTTTPATATELLRILDECKRGLDESVQQRGYNYYNETDDTRIERAREVLRKSEKTVAATREWQNSLRQTLSGPNNLWAPFWTDVLGESTLSQRIREVNEHDLMVKSAAKRAEWKAEVVEEPRA